MKINKNIILTTLLPILFFSAVKVASADTYIISYKAANNSDFVTAVVDYGIDKRTYKQGEIIHPSRTNYGFSLKCLNAGNVNEAIKTAFSNFEIGNPGTTYTSYTVLEGLTPNYIYAGKIFTKNGSSVVMASLDNSHSTYSYNTSSGRYESFKRTIDLNSIEAVEINSSGEAFAVSYKYGPEYTYDPYTGYGDDYPAIDSEPSTIPYKVATGLTAAYQSGVRRINKVPDNRVYRTFTDTRSILMRSGSLVFGTASLPGQLTIPTDATPGSYVAQVDFNPGWGANPPSPRKTVTTGAWNTKTCWDGSQVPQSQDCPVQLYNCPDGQRLAVCTTQRCWDGSIIPTSQNCPVRMQTCWDGSVIPTSQNCPTQYKYCPDGPRVPVDQNCPPPRNLQCPYPPGDRRCLQYEQDALYFFEKFFNIKRVNAIIERMEMETIAQNGGGGYSGGGSYTPPSTCGSNWWCTITLSAVTISVPFEVLSNNQPPAVQVR